METKYTITYRNDWSVPNLHIIEIDGRSALKFTLNGEEVTNKTEILQACDFYSNHCRSTMRRYPSGKKNKAAQNELKLLSAYAFEQLTKIQNQTP